MDFPILSPPSHTSLPMHARSLTAPSRQSSVTTAVSLITLRLARSSSLIALSSEYRAPTPPNRTVVSSVPSTPSIISCGPFRFRLIYLLFIGLTPSTLPHISSIVIPLKLYTAKQHTSPYMAHIHHILISEFLVVHVTPTSHPLLPINYHLAPPCVSSLATSLTIKDTGVLTSTRIGSLSLIMLSSMILCFHSL
jgi:hypothetical protein